jgi:hypothetical protein
MYRQAATRGRRPTGGRRPLRAAVAGSPADRRSPDGRPLPDRRSPVPGNPRSLTSGWSAVGDRPSTGAPLCPPPAPLAQPPCPQNFAHAVNYSSLAAAHARPAQTSPSNFKHA